VARPLQSGPKKTLKKTHVSIGCPARIAPNRRSSLALRCFEIVFLPFRDLHSPTTSYNAPICSHDVPLHLKSCQKYWGASEDVFAAGGPRGNQGGQGPS
jgi:hypothetical protein